MFMELVQFFMKCLYLPPFFNENIEKMYEAIKKANYNFRSLFLQKQEI